jgi:fumarylacetoacetase
MDLQRGEVRKHLMQSWVEGANDPHGFGLGHLPYGAFVVDGVPHLCVRIGAKLFDLHTAAGDEIFDPLSPEVCEACRQPTLHSLLALGPRAWKALREHLTVLLAEGADKKIRKRIDWFLHVVEQSELTLPVAPRGYTDFYASIHHARRVGELFRPDAPLLPNYKYVPIAYNGRASSIVNGGTPVTRPWGQQRPRSEGELPRFAPSAALDYELELGFIVGQGNALGEPVPINRANEHLFGVTLLNDWSARDIQSWEYQPLGPFLGKSFATSVSPWITPMAALEPFRVPPTPRQAGDPQPLPYLSNSEDQQHGAYDITLNVSLSTAQSRAAGLAPFAVSQSNAHDLFWTPAQMLAHHTSNGCNLEPGDILGTGTTSGPQREQAACLLELTRNGAEPFALPNGERRAWLEDGDEVILSARCEHKDAELITLAECSAQILSAVAR